MYLNTLICILLLLSVNIYPFPNGTARKQSALNSMRTATQLYSVEGNSRLFSEVMSQARTYSGVCWKESKFL